VTQGKFWKNLLSKVRKPDAKNRDGNQIGARFVPLPPESNGHDMPGLAAVESV
jgi:hypothetical protein